MSRFSRAALICFLFCGFTPHGTAAPRNDPPPAELQDLARELAPFIKANPVMPPRKILHTQTKPKNPATPVEESFSRRANQDIRLFGYHQIGRHLSDIPVTGQVQDDMVLGVGDSVIVTFRGQRDDSRAYRITPQGDLIVQGLKPIAASGMTVAGLRTLLETETKKHFQDSTVFVSVKELRQMAVTVMGEVNKPGVFTLSPFQTVLDALAMAKGINKNGSLRQITLLRNGKSIPLDLYRLLLQGDLGTSIHLRDGDKIMVPVLGSTLAVAGDVKRPAIFESLSQKSPFTFDEVIRLAGGVVRPGANRFVKLSFNSWGDELVEEITPGDKVTFQDGDILMVSSGDPMRTNSIQVMGHVRQQGPRALDTTPDLKSLLPNMRILKDGVYPLIAVIDRVDPGTLTHELIAFSPAAVLQKKENRALEEGDHIVFFSYQDIDRILNPKPKKKNKTASSKDELRTWMREEKERRKQNSVIDAFDENPALVDDEDNPLLTTDMIAFLREHAAYMNGAVMRPGLYPVAGKTPLQDLITLAGGLTPAASKQHVEIILANHERNGKRYSVDLGKDHPDKILIAPQDNVVISEEYTVAEKSGITLMGEVKRPGTYAIRKGDTLLDLLHRAGGVTENGYANGIVFMRESERRKQAEQFRRIARELDMSVAGYYLKKDGAQKNAEQIRVVQKIADDLRHTEAIGRITVEADMETLLQHPERAILLEAGDKIYIPRRPTSVAVAGEVLSPATLQYIEAQSGSDYIRQAGGTTQYADTGRNFVVFPDGSAAPLSGSMRWKDMKGIPPGSTIIVPRDPDPLDFLQVTQSIGNIMAQLAITSIGIAQIQNGY